MQKIKMKEVSPALQRPGEMPFDKAEVIDFFEGFPRGIYMATCSSDRTYRIYRHLGDEGKSFPMPSWLQNREVLIYANQHFRDESWLEMLSELPSNQTRGWDSPVFGVEL